MNTLAELVRAVTAELSGVNRKLDAILALLCLQALGLSLVLWKVWRPRGDSLLVGRRGALPRARAERDVAEAAGRGLRGR